MIQKEKINQGFVALFEGNLSLVKNIITDLTDNINQDNPLYFSFLNLKGYSFLENSQYEQAMKIYEEYVNLAKQKKDLDNLHIGLHQLAMVYREKKEYKNALDLINREHKIIIDNFPEDSLKNSINLYEQGYLHLKLNRYKKALILLEESLKFALESEDLISIACSYRALGETYASLSNEERAVQNFKLSIEYFERAGDEIGKREVEKMLEEN
ncbi:tetratricopeptide repeat protein [Floricoccus penangensis]|uniref:tetratricopeptide repeat protein n=1 Tax=Floricoccus penangensis TaxID=1859475 RepID=UPI00203B41AC|nr:tetratricopeptide repeat protein [Floricoccus penangensis]URZ86561.1 tetratricopeptide repeat protein [Floricoccus penangensis]